MGVVTFLSENINYKELRKYFPSLLCIVLCCQVPFLVVLASVFLAGGCGPDRSPQPGTPHGGPRARDLVCTSTPSLQWGLHAHPRLGRRPQAGQGSLSPAWWWGRSGPWMSAWGGWGSGGLHESVRAIVPQFCGLDA